jgi:hypothetical protein
MSRTCVPFVLALLTVTFLAGSASAQPAVIAGGLAQYWYGFKQFWGEVFGSVGGVVLVVLVVGAISLFIITRGKWRK